MQERFERGFKVSSIVQLTVSPPEREVNSAWGGQVFYLALSPQGFQVF